MNDPLLGVVEVGWVGLAFSAALLAVLVVLSATFSGSETALFSLTRLQLQENAASSNPFRRLAADVMRRPADTLLIILIANTAVNVMLFAASYVTMAGVSARVGPWAEPVGAFASIALVMVGGEVVPKIISAVMANTLAPYAAVVVRVCGYALAPAGRVLGVVLVEPLTRLVIGRARESAVRTHDLSTSELKALLDLSRRQGWIDTLENQLLREVVDLGQVRVRDVMVPRVEVQSYDIDAPAEGLRELMRATRRKKIPVYDGTIDNIVGLVYAKVLFFNPDQPLRSLVTPVRFVPEIITCEQLLHHFRNTKTQLAIAVDEYGGMAGLVTLEDVLEEIVGDIRQPEDQPAEPEVRQVSEAEYDVSGRLSVRYWSHSFGSKLAGEWVATVGGLVTSRLGRPARVGDVVRFGNVELSVTQMHRHRVDRLRLRLLDHGNSEGAA